MVEMELPKNPSRKQKQPISVPFIWETKPGTPKNDWKPVRPSRPPPPPPPIKLIASVPFEWEEKPGKPLPSFPHPVIESEIKNENNLEYKTEREMIFESFNFQIDKSFNFQTNALMPPPTHRPIKLGALIPFGWEEKPGKPLPFFPRPLLESRNKNENNIGDKNVSNNESKIIFESFNFQIDKLFNFQTNGPMPPHHPVKFCASIPFEWEEKPGKPLPSYALPIKEFENETNDKKEMNFKENSFKTNEASGSLPSGWVPFESDENPEKTLPSFPFYSPTNYSQNISNEDESEIISESDSESLSFHTDESESVGSVPSLLANRIMPAGAIANAIPVLETQPDYESDSSTSSYATGTTSLVGAPFLEKLFPLLSPKLSFLGKVEEKEKSFKENKMKLPSKDSYFESSFSDKIRRPTTLGELIMMSRRRSFIRKAVQIPKHNSMESMRKVAMGCFMFGINDRIEGLQRKMKRQLQLKLI